MLSRKGQVAMEFLMITGFFLLIVIPTIFYFYTYTQESTIDVEISKASAIGNSVIETAETVYYYGKDAKLTMNIDLPSGVQNMSVRCENDDAMAGCFFQMYVFGNELFFPTKIPLDPSFEKKPDDSSPYLVRGKHKIVLETMNSGTTDYVKISFE